MNSENVSVGSGGNIIGVLIVVYKQIKAG
jgi:hypothetical protein